MTFHLFITYLMYIPRMFFSAGAVIGYGQCLLHFLNIYVGVLIYYSPSELLKLK